MADSKFILYHHWACPYSRRVRLHLAECNVGVQLKLELPWERREEFLQMNLSGDVPVLCHKNGFVVSGAYAISEYIESKAKKGLFGSSPEQGVEIRRIMEWFDKKFYADVYNYIIHERMVKTLMRRGSPNSKKLKAGYSNLEFHLNYFEWLLQKRSLLAGEFLSLADLTAAGHLSGLDYLGCIAWEDYPSLKLWYMRLKSRPCFRGLLRDNILEIAPVGHYADLDF